jgi:hypothetical protein
MGRLLPILMVMGLPSRGGPLGGQVVGTATPADLLDCPVTLLDVAGLGLGWLVFEVLVFVF